LTIIDIWKAMTEIVAWN